MDEFYECVGTCAHVVSAILSVGLHMHMSVFDDAGDTRHVFVIYVFVSILLIAVFICISG